MISTITTSTISTITALGIGGSVALIGILVLLVLLIQKELSSASPSAWAKKLNKVLNISIAPLLLAFVLIVATRVFDALK